MDLPLLSIPSNIHSVVIFLETFSPGLTNVNSFKSALAFSNSACLGKTIFFKAFQVSDTNPPFSGVNVLLEISPIKIVLSL